MKKLIGALVLTLSITQVYAETLADLYTGIEEVIASESDAKVVETLKDTLKALYPKLSADGKKDASEAIHKIWPDAQQDAAGNYVAPHRFAGRIDELLAELDKGVTGPRVQAVARAIKDAYVGTNADIRNGMGITK